MSSLVTPKNALKLIALLTAGHVVKTVFFPSKVKDLKGKSVLITGAAAGIGRNIALELARQGEATSLILWDIQADELEKTKESIKGINSKVTVHTQIVNLVSKEAIYSKAKQCIEFMNGLSPDVIINNAGIISGGKGLLETPDERIELEVQLNTLAHVFMTKAFLPTVLSTNKNVHFVNVTSMAAYVAASDIVTYAMSKKGAKGFAEGLAAEMKQKGYGDRVKVTCVCPAHVDTALFKGFQAAGAKTMTPEYVAQEIIHAIETETEIVVLPKHLRGSIVFIGLSEFLGRLNLPSQKTSVMKNWSTTQADKLFDTMKKSSL